jgi:hypothetical protein
MKKDYIALVVRYKKYSIDRLYIELGRFSKRTNTYKAIKDVIEMRINPDFARNKIRKPEPIAICFGHKNESYQTEESMLEDVFTCSYNDLSDIEKEIFNS